MDSKQRLLIDRMRTLRTALRDAASHEPRIQAILSHYNPFFDEIEAGRIVPPWGGRYRNPIFAKDSAFEDKYGRDSMLSRADADFMSALEDWPSQAWFQRISNPTDRASFVDWRSPDAPPSLRRFFWRLGDNILWHTLRLKVFLGSWWRH